MGQFGAGQGLHRLEDERLLRGAGRYTDDIALPGQVYGVLLRSPLAHARIGAIDTADAKAMPGVLAVYTAADLAADGIGDIPCLAPVPGKNGTETILPPNPVLARDVVRHVGDPVAFVVAESLAEAKNAAEAVMVDYEDLPAVVDTGRAQDADAPQVYPEAPGNLCVLWAQGNEDQTAAAFAKAPRHASIEIVNNRVVVNAIEPRVALGEYDGASQRLTLHVPSQGVFRLLGQFTETIFKIPKEQFRIVTHDVGGGFGMKIFCYPEQVMVLYAARKLGRPVRWTGERTEGFLSDTQGRDHVTRAEMAMDEEGRFLALRADTVANIGAYVSNFGPFVPTACMTQMYSGLYRIPAIYGEVACVFTHTVSVDAYRGAGRPEAAYMMERLVDACAREMGVDGREIRRRNFIRTEHLPYDTGLMRIYDSGDYTRLMDEATERADWEGIAPRKAQAAGRGKLRGIGLASYVEACGGIGAEEARLTLDPDGGVTLHIGTMTNGQGHHTAYSQLIHDKLGIDPDKVRMRQGDSAELRRGGGTGGSRSLLMGGVAVQRASDNVIETVRQIAGHHLEAAAADIEFEDGIFRIVGTDRQVSLAEMAAASHAGELPEGMEGPVSEHGHYEAEALTFPNGCHVCELEVDEDTGVIEILRYVVVDDFGTIVNHALVAGQVHGGTIQGLGQALLENAVYDTDGQLVTASFMDYCMPRADDAPNIELTLVEDMPCTTNPLGVKGAGEAGAIGAPPAIMNALMDALSPIGVRRLDMPATPERVWRAIQDAKAEQREAAE